jgi:hypothetical protein
MKTLFTLLLSIVLSTISSSSLLAQCGPDSSVLTIKYDTILYGSGNNGFSVSFPKFNPALGTLLSADIKSAVNVDYGFVATNTAPSAQLLKVKIGREDDIFTSALIDPLSTETQSAWITKLVLGNSAYTYGPAYMASTSTTSITDGQLINFEGAGTVDFDYETEMTETLIASTTFTWSFPAINDTTNFSVTYRYCTASLLSSDLLSFTATSQSKNTVLLNWHQATVQADRIYGVQVSTDGITFGNIANVTENASGFYSYNYVNSSSAKKLFFRIQEKNISGEIKYSNIRMVEFNDDTKASVQVFPALYSGGNLQVNFPEKSDWQVMMYASDGRKIFANRQNDVSATSFQVPTSLGNGIYIIETVNLHSQQSQISRIVVQR